MLILFHIPSLKYLYAFLAEFKRQKITPLKLVLYITHSTNTKCLATSLPQGICSTRLTEKGISELFSSHCPSALWVNMLRIRRILYVWERTVSSATGSFSNKLLLSPAAANSINPSWIPLLLLSPTHSNVYPAWLPHKLHIGTSIYFCSNEFPSKSLVKR